MAEPSLQRSQSKTLRYLMAVVGFIMIMASIYLLSCLPSGLGVTATLMLSLIMTGSLSFFLYVILPDLSYYARNLPEENVELGIVNEGMEDSPSRRTLPRAELESTATDSSDRSGQTVESSVTTESELNLNKKELGKAEPGTSSDKGRRDPEETSYLDMGLCNRKDLPGAPNYGSIATSHLYEQLNPPAPLTPVRSEESSEERKNNSSVDENESSREALKICKDAVPGTSRTTRPDVVPPARSNPSTVTGTSEPTYYNVPKTGASSDPLHQITFTFYEKTPKLTTSLEVESKSKAQSQQDVSHTVTNDNSASSTNTGSGGYDIPRPIIMPSGLPEQKTTSFEKQIDVLSVSTEIKCKNAKSKQTPPQAVGDKSSVSISHQSTSTATANLKSADNAGARSPITPGLLEQIKAFSFEENNEKRAAFKKVKFESPQPRPNLPRAEGSGVSSESRGPSTARESSDFAGGGVPKRAMSSELLEQIVTFSFDKKVKKMSTSKETE